MLDSLFTQTSELLGEDTEDVTGMIGQYLQGNEPAHNFAYLYDFIDKSEKTQFYTNKTINTLDTFFSGNFLESVWHRDKK